MLTIPLSVIRDCLAVFRRALPKPLVARAATPIHVIGERECLRLRLMQPDVAIEYCHPSPSRCQALIIPLCALADCEGRGDGIVQFQLRDNGKVELRWKQNSIPCQRVYNSCKSSETPFPAWPTRDCANDPSLLEALDEAMQIPTGNPGRLSLTYIQLRGKQGDVVATDGHQLLIQGGFQFPWKESLLVSRTPIFAACKLAKGEVVRVAQTKTHVCWRIGSWTIALAIESSTRFPNVEAVIPKIEHAVALWHVGDDEARALVKMLDTLPAAKEDQAPVTLDLARPIVIRARAEEEERCTEVLLTRSRLEGKSVRLVADRRYLQRTLELGFRSVLITAPDKPILCQEGKRLYVWVPLDSKSALVPQAHAIGVMLPAVSEKSRRTVTAPEPAHHPVPTLPVPSAQSRGRVRVFDGFLHCARSLWNLVRKHRRKERVK